MGRRRIGALLVAALVGAALSPGAVAAQAGRVALAPVGLARPSNLRVIPFPGTPDAAPSSQIIFSALKPSDLVAVQVKGSR